MLATTVKLYKVLYYIYSHAYVYTFIRTYTNTHTHNIGNFARYHLSKQCSYRAFQCACYLFLSFVLLHMRCCCCQCLISSSFFSYVICFFFRLVVKSLSLLVFSSRVCTHTHIACLVWVYRLSLSIFFLSFWTLHQDHSAPQCGIFILALNYVSEMVKLQLRYGHSIITNIT